MGRTYQTDVRGNGRKLGLLGVLALAVATMVSAVAPAQAQAPALQPLATTVGVEPQATGLLGGTEVTIILGSQLYQGQTIRTGPNGEVQIIFSDDTRMVIGPNSTLVIETYLLRNPTTVSSFVVNAIGGTFRFITGNSPSTAYTINTPTGTIGVRGTWFDFFVDLVTGATDVIVYEGQVLLCGTTCVTIDAGCLVGRLGADGTTDLATEAQRVALALQKFLYAQDDENAELNVDFQFEDLFACLGPLPTRAQVGDDVWAACLHDAAGNIIDLAGCLEAIDRAIVVAQAYRQDEDVPPQSDIGQLLCEVARAYPELLDEILDMIDDSFNLYLKAGCQIALAEDPVVPPPVPPVRPRSPT